MTAEGDVEIDTMGLHLRRSIPRPYIKSVIWLFANVARAI